jgi:rubrerythrin
MSKSLKGTRTEKNLLAAFAGESQARNRYTFFAEAARREGYEQIADIFEETAGNEREHARVFFGFLEGGDAEITAAYPAGVVGDTLSNLNAAADGERLEWTTLYADFEGIAREEGFNAVAIAFKNVAAVEVFHEERYRKLAANVENGTVFKKPKTVRWHCTNCGYIHEGPEPPKGCPTCKKGRAYFEVLAENY